MWLTTSYKMGIAALIMAGSVILSRFMGLIRDKVISWEFGATAEADIYFAAFVIPDFINYLLAGGYISITLIPLLSKSFQEDEQNGWKFFSTVFYWATLAISVITLIAWFFAYDLAKITAPGFTAFNQERLGFFLRIILPGQIFFISGACISALLYIRKQFLAPALMPIIYNSCIMLGGLISSSNGMEGFCWGVLIGAALGAFLLPFGVGLINGIHFYFSLRHPLMKHFLWLALPLMLGQSIIILDEQLIRIFGSLAGEGAVSLLNYARRIMLVPVGVVAQSISVASFPFLATLAAKNNNTKFNETLNKALKGSLIIALPITGWMIGIALPTLGIIFEGGRFSHIQTVVATPLLQIMLFSIPFWVVQQVIGRAFYARQNTLTPALIGTFSTVIFIPFFSISVKSWGSIGIASLTTISIITYTFLISYKWYKTFGITAFTGLKTILIRSFFIVIPSGLSAWIITTLTSSFLTSFSPFILYLLKIAINTVTFGIFYFILAFYFFPPISNIIQNYLKKLVTQLT